MRAHPQQKGMLLCLTKSQNFRSIRNEPHCTQDCPGRMANASNSTIPFLRDFKIDDLKEVSFKPTATTATGDTQSTQTTKASIPIIPVGATPHQALHCPHVFKRAKAILKWNQGPKPFKAIQFVLEDPGDTDHWDGLCSEDPNHQSVDTFNGFIKRCINCWFDKDAKVCRNHKRFLVDIKKPKALKVCEFVTLLQCHNETVLPMPPGAPEQNASHNNEDVKHIVFNAMPIT